MAITTLSCRTGPLRAARVLTHLFTGFASPLPMVGLKILILTIGKAT